MKSKFVAFIAVSSAASLFTGCVSTSHVGAFSQAAVQAVTQVANGFDEVQQTTVTRKLSDIASDTNTPTEATFAGLLDTNELAPRLDCLAEIKNYADSLGKLANADFRKDIDAASANLYGALNGLTARYQKVTGTAVPNATEDTAIIAAAVDAIGNSIAEAKRQAALRKIILKTDPVIQAVCADLERTFNGFNQDHFVFENLNSQVADMTSYYNMQTAKWNYEQRMAYLQKILQTRSVRDGSETFIALAAKSVAALAKAHKALADSADDGKLTSSEVVQAVSALADEANQTKQFYDKIHGGN
jgi:hypothetical protein